MCCLSFAVSISLVLSAACSYTLYLKAEAGHSMYVLGRNCHTATPRRLPYFFPSPLMEARWGTGWITDILLCLFLCSFYMSTRNASTSLPNQSVPSGN